MPEGRTNHIQVLAKLLEEANLVGPQLTGRCEWRDLDGNPHCNNFSQFQCQQVAGTWDSARRCDPSEA
jgi:hypothetical protein